MLLWVWLRGGMNHSQASSDNVTVKAWRQDTVPRTSSLRSLSSEHWKCQAGFTASRALPVVASGAQKLFRSLVPLPECTTTNSPSPPQFGVKLHRAKSSHDSVSREAHNAAIHSPTRTRPAATTRWVDSGLKCAILAAPTCNKKKRVLQAFLHVLDGLFGGSEPVTVPFGAALGTYIVCAVK